MLCSCDPPQTAGYNAREIITQLNVLLASELAGDPPQTV